MSLSLSAAASPFMTALARAPDFIVLQRLDLLIFRNAGQRGVRWDPLAVRAMTSGAGGRPGLAGRHVSRCLGGPDARA
jgi:hypothetical protein